MPNKYVNKVVIGKETKLDLTADTITPDKLAKVSQRTTSPAPYYRYQHERRGYQRCYRSCGGGFERKTFYARGAKMTGTMPNNGEVNGEISTVSGKYTIPMGFHDGAGG